MKKKHVSHPSYFSVLSERKNDDASRVCQLSNNEADPLSLANASNISLDEKESHLLILKQYDLKQVPIHIPFCDR